MKASAYYRMSSDDQSTSIPQQKQRVEAYAREKGHDIAAIYIDEGKSGSLDQDKRTEFRRMLADASKGEWQVVLCLNTSRFGRLDTIDGAYAKQTLRQEGISLETVEEGRIDWNLAEDRMKEFFLAEANHKRSREISRDSLRGRNDKAKQGKWPYGIVPYGYDRNYIDERGNTHRVGRQELFRKARGWQLELVVNDAEAKIIRRIYDEFHNRDTSLRSIASRLNDDGIPSPSGDAGWSKDSVKAILKNKNYVGSIVFGIGRKSKKHAFNRATPSEIEDVIPAIIEKPIFQAVQDKLARKRNTNSKPQSRSSSPLIGIVICGHCGKRMQRQMKRWGRPEKQKKRPYFVCSTGIRRPNHKCRQWRVAEDILLPFVLQAVREGVDFELLNAIHARPEDENKADVDGLKRQIKQAEKRLDKAADRYLAADTEMLPVLQKKMKAIQQEIEGLQHRLRVIEVARNMDQVSSWQAWWDSVKDRLVIVSDIEWGNAQSQKQAIVLCQRDRNKIVKRLGNKAGKVRVRFKGCNDFGNWGDVVFDEAGSMVEMDDEGQAWLWQEVEFPIKPAVMAEADKVRELLHKLGVSLTVFYKMEGDCCVLDKGKLEAKINWGESGKSYQYEQP